MSIGLSIDASDGSATGGTVVTKAGSNVGITPVPFTTKVLQDYANETAKDERNHVSFLQAGIKGKGGVAVAMPNIDLFNSFNTLANAAGLGATFDPFADETSFLLGAFIFEDVGVTAYNGAAGLLTDKNLLQYAAGILAVEAYHAGSIRTRIYAAGATAQAASQKIAATRASLSAAGGATATDDVGVGNDTTGAATIVDADANGITFSRNTTEVLSIVYGGGKGGGAFCPNGLNANITNRQPTPQRAGPGAHPGPALFSPGSVRADHDGGRAQVGHCRARIELADGRGVKGEELHVGAAAQVCCQQKGLRLIQRQCIGL